MMRRGGVPILVILIAGLIAPAFTPSVLAGEPPPLESRTIDGSGNNLVSPAWGSAGETLLRMTSPAYGDGAGSPAGAAAPGARWISNAVSSQQAAVQNPAGATDLLWQWGQFLDHDIGITGAAPDGERFDIPVPAGDPLFDPQGTGTAVIPMVRSGYRTVAGVREQINSITAYIDASQIYGSDPVRAAALRAMDGTGRLATSRGRMLPYNVQGLPNAPDSTDSRYYLAGDIRANEQVGLTALHTLFVREHNHWVRVLRREFPSLDGDGLYELARAMVGAEMQVITYNEYLPLLLGWGALEPYTGYDPAVNAGIANEFSSAAYRFGHTMIPATLLRLRRNGRPVREGALPLRDAFFMPGEIDTGRELNAILRGLTVRPAEEIDGLIVDDLRNFLFGEPGSGGFDLAALNIQRGRDHGLPRYNQLRIEMGLAPATGFEDLSSSAETVDRLSTAYQTVDEIDAWVGALVEDHVPGAMVGELCLAVIKDQFERLRDGDRFWYEHHLPADLAALAEEQTLARIIRRNTAIGRELQDDVFMVPPAKKRAGRGAAGGGR